MNRPFSGSAVPRHFVYVLADGSFVVQWDENRIQNLLTGHYRTLKDDDFGHPITDSELSQLKSSGRVEYFNRNYVWLYALPETGRFRFDPRGLDKPSGRIRAYYLNTTLSKTYLEKVASLLVSLGMGEELSARPRGELVAIVRKSGSPFEQFKEAEIAQKQLLTRAPKIFGNAAVAFVELAPGDTQLTPESNSVVEPSADLATVIASQTDTTVTQDKRILLLISHDDDRRAYSDLCAAEMKMVVRAVGSGSAALECLEDEPIDLMVMDLQLPDMHGWELLMKMKEIARLRNLPVIVLADSASSPNEQAFALTVAKVEVYLVKPVGKARLRQNIWMALKHAS